MALNGVDGKCMTLQINC